MTQHTRNLGDLTVPAIGLGCMPMTVSYGIADQASGRETLEHAVHSGATFWDTADMYGAGRNEKLLSHVLKRHRDDVVLASKVGLTTWPVVPMPRGIDNSAGHLRKGLEDSLKRLGTDHLDLYYLHRIAPDVPVEESVAVLAEFVRAGKVRYIGLSEPTADQLRRAHGVHPVTAVQSEWSLFSREIEDDVVPTARELGIGIVAYSPLGRGMLTGDPSSTTNLSLLDYRRGLPRWRKANLEANLRAVETVRAVATSVGATPAQVALAWLLAKGEDVVPIPGTSKAHRVEENMAAVRTVLTAEDLAALDGLVATGGRMASGSKF